MVEVSIIIPTYNRAEAVQRAIDSALGQTLSDIEVIVVDDASSDNTGSVVEKIEDSRLVYVTHEVNRGGSAARNTGIDHSQGDYIAFLDSDDSWKPTKLEKQVAELESRSAEWIAAYCDFRQKRPNQVVECIDNRIRRPTGLEGGEELIDRILLRTFAHGGASTLLVDAAAVERIDGFNPAFQRHQDLEFLIRLLQVGKLAYVDEILVYKHDTGNPESEVVVEAMEFFNESFAELINERGLEDTVKDRQQFMLAKNYFQEGRFREGMKQLIGSECPHYRDALGLGFAGIRGIDSKLKQILES